MRVYADTNVLIDFVCKRENYFPAAQELFAAAYIGRISLLTSALSVVNTMYVARKHGSEIVRNRLKQISQFVQIVDLRASIAIDALDSEWKDYEDATQALSAVAEYADCIVSRNTKDFEKPLLPVYTVDEFLDTIS